jgi:heptosyltransferase II
VSKQAPASVLVLRFSAVGDVILTASALHALKLAWPETRVLFATKARFACLVADNPDVDEVISLEVGESFGRYRRRLAERRPEAILDLHQKLRSAGLRWLIPAQRKVVWHKRPLLHGLKVRLGLGPYHAASLLADRYHVAVEELVGRSLPHGQLSFSAREDARGRMRAHLIEAGIDLGRPLVGMAPGAMWETKRWPPERYAELAARCVAAGSQVVLSGSPDEAAVTAGIAVRAPGVVDLAGKVSLADLAAFIDLCSAFVANDSGPMHLSRALGVPTLAFFGSTDPAQFDFTGHALMFVGAECSPCSLYGRPRCPKSHFRCMLEVDVDRAYAALRHLMAGPRRVPLVRG